MAKLKIGEFELIDHGIDGSQYFPGCGTTFTRFNHVATGCGDNPSEALDDLIEMVSQYATPNGKPRIVERDGQSYVNQDAWDSFDAEDLYERIIAEEGDNPNLVTNEDGTKGFPEKPSANEKFMEANDLDEPDREDFDSDEEYEEACERIESQREEMCDVMDNYYYMSLRWNEAKEENEE